MRDRSAPRIARGTGRIRARRRRRGAAALCTGALTAVLLIAAWTASASAVVVQLSNGSRVSYQPVSSPLAPAPLLRSVKPLAQGEALIYHGGPVMTSNTNYAFYWSPGGEAAYPAGYIAGIDGYLAGLAADSGKDTNVDSVSAQYTNGLGESAAYASTFAGAIIDTDPYPPNGCTAAPRCLTKEQLEAELQSYVSAHHLPADLWHEYFVLTPPAVESCFGASSEACSAGSSSPEYCAWHSDIADGGGVIVFADNPYAGGVEGCDTGKHPSESPAEGTLQGGLSHEHNESVTDPELNAWFGPEGDEVADKCRSPIESTEFGVPLGTAADGAPYNQVVDGVEYLYQQEWSNRTLSCEQRMAPEAPAVSKLSAKKGAATGETSVTITGRGLTGAEAVAFGPTPARSFEVKSATTIVAVSPPGTTGVVDVSVSTAGGTSAIVPADRFTYGSPTITGVGPSSGLPAGGTEATITGSGFAPGASGTAFSFGKAGASSVSCSSSSTCTAISPPAAKAGTVDVKATVAGKRSAKIRPADAFTYS